MPDNDRYICIVSAFYKPHVGGVEVFSNSIACELESRGYKTCILTSRLAFDDPLIEDEKGRLVFRLPCRMLAKGRFPFPLKTTNYNLAIGRVLEEPITDVVVNTRFYPLSLTGLDIAEKKGIIPLVIDHGSGHLTFGIRVLDPIVRIYEHLMTEAGKRHKARYAAVSTRASAWLTHFSLRSLGEVHNSIDAKAFVDSSSGRDFRHELGIGEDDIVVSYAARMVHKKGADLLTRAAGKIDDPRVRFVLAGEGPLKGKLEADAMPNVHFVGNLGRADISALLAQSDLFCFPSEYPEGLPTSLLEAGSQAVPVIALSTGGTDDLFPSNEYGIVLGQEDKDTLSDAIRWMIEHPEERVSMGLNLQRRVYEEYSWAKAADDLLFLLDGIA